MWRVGLVFMSLFIALWKATQSVAKALQYDALLGASLMMDRGVPVYGPWKYVSWFFQVREFVPSAFRPTYMYFGIALFLSIGIMVAVEVMFKSKVSDNYGSAKFADRKEISKMDLISSKGVVVGLYDEPWKRKFTDFIREFDAYQKDKKAMAEMAFDNKWAEERDKLIAERDKAQEKFERDPDSKSLEAKVAKLQEKIDNPPKFKEPWNIKIFTSLYKQLYSLYKKMPHFYLRDNSNKHMAVIAPTRSGKGVGLIIPTLLGQWDSSCIVNDIKSENWAVTAGYRKKMGHTCIKFEPTAADGSSARWNPLDEIPIGTPKEQSMAVNIAHVLADYEGKGKLDHWGSNAETVIMTVILHLSYAHYADPENYPMKPTFSTVANFLKANIVEEEAQDEDGNPIYDEETGEIKKEINPKGFVDTLRAIMDFEHVPEGGIEIEYWDPELNNGEGGFATRHFDEEMMHEMYPTYTDIYKINPHVHPLIYKNFMEISSKPANECGSIVSTANTALKEYLDPVLSENTSVSDFCIDDVMNYKKPVSLYLVTPPSDLLRLAPIFRLFFEMMVKHHAARMGFVNARPVDAYKHKCLFLMDEFSSLGNLQAFAATLSYIAGYGMKVFLINQGLPQINSIYTKDNQILMNCHLQIIYAPNDNETAEYAEKMIGKKTVKTYSKSKSGDKLIGGTNVSENETGRALLSADEIKRLGEHELIVPSGVSPIYTDKVKYYEDKFFMSKLCEAPVVSDVTRVDEEKLANPKRQKLLMQKAKEKKLKKDRISFEFDSTLEDTGFRLRKPRERHFMHDETLFPATARRAG